MTRTSAASVLKLKGRWKPFRFIGNYRCLDFVNTEAKKSGDIVDFLHGDEDLVTWLISAKLFERTKLNQSLKKWEGKQTSGLLLSEGLRLRGVVEEMAGQIVARREVSRSALQAINRLIRTRSGTTRLVKTRAGFCTRFEPELNEPQHLLVPIALSAADLLCDGDFSRVKQCSNQDCGAFFYDTSKNRRRRWCAGSSCGNRIRVAAFYRRRHRNAGGEQAGKS
jgi:predicted RNA-binding Zn ribbon-like protein